jgi:uncharacterized short protein YbdD (DUF466 family)
LDQASIERLAQSCSRQNYHPVFVAHANIVSPDMAQNDNFQGMITPAATMPLAANHPALQEFRAAMSKYAGGQTLMDGMVESWTAGKLLEAGAKGLPDGDVPTLRKALLNGLWGLHSYDPILAGTQQYNPNQPATRTVCWFMETIQDHRFVSDGNRTCTPYDPSLVG